MSLGRSLGHFLESRTSFLTKVVNDLTRNKASSQEKVLLASIQQVSKTETTERSKLTVEVMMQCGMHLGHSKSHWHPAMSKYILGERHGVHVIDLDKTLICLRQACSVACEIAYHKGSILFVGTSPNLQRLTFESASYAGQYYVNRRWLGGTISNGRSVLKTDAKPDLVIILDLMKNQVAAKECWNASIPVIAICDTNCDPRRIAYPIPSNDDSLPAIELIARSLALAAKRGVDRRQASVKADVE
jgi:small subunit ribosomal protein S2